MSIQVETRSRLRFDSLEHVTTPDGSGRVSVRLEWQGDTFEGTVPCLQTQQGVLKAASQAALSATLQSTSGAASQAIELEVVGVKAVRAFDGWVVVREGLDLSSKVLDPGAALLEEGTAVRVVEGGVQ